jgi:hypothetical protein
VQGLAHQCAGLWCPGARRKEGEDRNYNGSAGHDVIVSGTGGLAHLRGQGTFKQSGNGPVYKDWDVYFAS